MQTHHSQRCGGWGAKAPLFANDMFGENDYLKRRSKFDCKKSRGAAAVAMANAPAGRPAGLAAGAARRKPWAARYVSPLPVRLGAGRRLGWPRRGFVCLSARCPCVCCLAPRPVVPGQLPGAPPAAPAPLAVPKTGCTWPAPSTWPCAHANAHPALEVHLNGSLNAVNKRMHGCPSIPNSSIHFPNYLLCFSMGFQASRRDF